jgi:4-amino-4-deoxy-L-arabinose transferase-like glycosyltransferase
MAAVVCRRLFILPMTKSPIARPHRASNPPLSRSSILFFVALGGVLFLAAWLRWRYIVSVQPYPDEFVTLLAVRMILQKGVPVLPSGLFYEHGLLFSYAGAVGSMLLGFSREAVRATSLLLGILTVLLTWHVGRRWYSPATGLLAATLLAVAPTAVLWGGRARMYTLLQALVLLTLYFAFTGVLTDRPRGSPARAGIWRRLALVCYLGATLTQFVAIALIPPLALAMVALGWIGARQRGKQPWFQSRRVWLEVAGLVTVALVAFLVKRAGQPKGIAPLEATGTGVVAGLAQVAAIYANLSTDLAGGWRSVAPFFTAPEAVLPTALALLAMGWAGINLLRRRPARRDLATLFLALILAVTTLEMFFFVSPERRDDKYLFMLQPALFLLAADGLTRLGNRFANLRSENWGIGESGNRRVGESGDFWSLVLCLVACLALVVYTWPATSALLARTGSDYDTAFGYVRIIGRKGMRF